MLEIKIKTDAGGTMDRLAAALNNVAGDIALQTAIAINYAAKFHRRQIAKQIKKLIAIRNLEPLEKATKVKQASPSNLVAEIHIERRARISLKEFSPTQTRAGVSYRISKTGGRKLLPGAFGPDIAKLHHHVFKREGKEREPIVFQAGPRMSTVYQKNNLSPWSEQDIQDRLEHELERRIKAVIHGKVRRVT